MHNEAKLLKNHEHILSIADFRHYIGDALIRASALAALKDYVDKAAHFVTASKTAASSIYEALTINRKDCDRISQEALRVSSSNRNRRSFDSLR